MVSIKGRLRRKMFIVRIMANSDGFYLTLPSDRSMATFPNNTVAQFETFLPERIDLTEGEWEVGLREMMYGSCVKIFPMKKPFSTLITQEFRAQIKDPNHFQIIRFHLENKNYSTSLSKCFTLVDWASS